VIGQGSAARHVHTIFATPFIGLGSFLQALYGFGDPIAPGSMSLRLRLLTLCLFTAGLLLFAAGPTWFAPGTDGSVVWQAAMALGGPLAAAIACFFASRHGTDRERAAWRHFCIGSGIYFLGNLGYLGLALAERVTVFPSLPEAAFFVMALFFAAGMLQFTQVKNRFGAVQIYNFGLIYCAVALSAIFVLNRNIATSVMPPLGTVVAFLYPALWFAVAAFGVLSLTLYAYGRRSVAYGLMVLAVLAEAVADGRYALALMDGSYQIGGITQLLWIASSGLIIWSAIEQIVETRRRGLEAEDQRGPARRNNRSIAQAIVPALAVGMILVSGALAGVVGGPPFSYVAAALAVTFALVAGLREHWIIDAQRRLRGTVEKSREELAASRKQLAAVLESTHDSVLVIDRNWRVTYWNRHAAEMIDQRDKLEVGISIWELLPAALTSGEGDYYKRVLATGRPEEFDFFVTDRQLWLGIRVFPTEEGVSIFFRDISEQKKARDAIEHLAHHDPLTGLANRVLFQKRLGEAQGNEVAVLLLDLDHFKEVNDALGHPVGDVLLVSVATRLRAVLGDDVPIARLGGDEFAAILIGHDGRNEVAMVASRLIESVGQPHVINGRTIRVRASIGIALASRKSGTTGLFKDADIALYAAKTEARGAYRFFEISMQIELLQKQALRSDLVDALERGEFSLAFQPLVDLHTNQVSGLEALLRWNHPRRGLVPPAEFIPVAEETGLIVPIGEWTLRQAALQATRWPDDVSVAVNLSSRQFADDDLADMIERVLAETGLPARRLELEITETVLMRDSSTNLETLRRLRQRGVKIALDDFGTGFSSLGYLQRFPFSKLKIDRAFISGLPDSEESQAIVRSVIGLGQSLGMRVTAEGVETAAQLAWVRTGCDEAQGYLLSRPVSAADVPRVLAELNAPRLARLAS
jgi:diguanylate cyclase (GGDEF)-like protein/PAS domain S-box-containing protein